ncbi:ABC transporter permease [Lacrimispora sp. 210928-DFI.3.58]|uniref:ABC transporter permease n=1 Tax=Lacrimispora sp. 210928-DFI.3.58 TaxID=2883214 RepID=UPI001D077317|nr:ABC transporter permease [Lacrimispora sp. 210928-DFI.3.58]MCB7317881.1 ABC transporter permease [Lacrimispora sp. 210928-DFI.3.58]
MAELISFIGTVINISIPILFAALGVLVMQLSGVLNIGAEGMMLIGAFAGMAGTWIFGNVWLGALFVAAVSALTGLLFAFFTVTMKANQTVVGVAFNILSTGLTTTLFRILFGMNSGETLTGFQPIGGAFSLPVYIGFGAVVLITLFMYKTRPGLMIRAAGEHPKAVDSVGLSVTGIRYAATMAGAVIIGFGGMYLSMGILSFFSEEMVTGRGYIALAAVIFGRYTAAGTLLAVLVFGAGEAAVYRLQALGSAVPSQLILMIPYVLTILIVAGTGRRSGGPAALGEPYRKGEN